MINKVLFIGSKSFGLETLRLIHSLTPGIINTIITCNDEDDKRSVKHEFIKFAHKYGFNLVFSDSKVKTRQIINDLQPDLCFVNGWYQLFDNDTLSIPKYGFIGIHHSILPKYRGGSPLVWQIMNDEKEIGSTLFYLDSGVDSGDIILQVKIPNNDLYINDARIKIETLILSELKMIWYKIINNVHSRVQQNHQEATFCSQLFPKDGKINWNLSAKRIVAQIRAQSTPYPCAFTFYNNQKIKIISASILQKSISGVPGQILGLDKLTGRLIVACSDEENNILLGQLANEDDEIKVAKELFSSIDFQFS